MTIGAVRAARYDTTVERGGAWTRIIRRSNLDGDVSITAPCALDVYDVIDTTAEHAPQPAFSPTGVIAADGLSVTFTLSSTFTAALNPGSYEYRLSVGDPQLNDVIIILRGYLTVADGVRQ